MKYSLAFTGSAKRDLKKIDKTFLIKIQKIINDEILVDPFAGNVLKGNQEVIAWKIRLNRVDYRIAYRIDQISNLVVIVMVGSRENFYKELEKRI